jgi:hypothetical protein
LVEIKGNRYNRKSNKKTKCNRVLHLVSIFFYSLKYVIPEAYIVQSTYAGIAKSAGIIFIQQIGSAELDQAFDLWQAIANLCIQRRE